MTGSHLMIDGTMKSKQNIDDIYCLIDALAYKAGINVISKPHVVKREFEPGLSGMLHTMTGYISLQTFSKDRRLCLDIFSCVPFETDKVFEKLKDVICVAESKVSDRMV